MYVVRLGNPAPVRATRDPKTDTMIITPVPVDEPALTEFTCYAPDLRSLLAETEDMWRHHGAEPPLWVSCANEAVEVLLSAHFGCDRGEPASKAAKAKARKGAR